MKAALIFPRTRYPSGDPPLGVAYLAAVFREQFGRAPAVLDTTFVPAPMTWLERELRAGQYDVVGISAMITMAREALAAARLARQARKDCLVLVGGPHATTLPEQVLQEPAVDAVCVGEGEETFVAALRQGGVQGVPGLYYRGAEGAVCGETREMIADLDRLPFPALELLPMDDYFAHWFQLDQVAPGLRGTSILATRGCPFQCSYCQPTLERLFGKGVRKRSPANVADELAGRRAAFGAEAFIFSDDTFIADRRWVVSFCGELAGRGLGLTWGCNVRADLVDPELLRLMHGVGLRKIYIGIEVYSDECRREVFRKRLTRVQVEAAVEAARALGIRTQGYFMLGAPGESRFDVRATMKYAWRLPIDDAVFNLTTPLPGTYLYERYRDRVAAPAEDMDYYRRYSLVSDQDLDQAWLRRIQFVSYAGFYLKPWRLMRQFRTLLEPGGPGRFASKLRRVI